MTTPKQQQAPPAGAIARRDPNKEKVNEVRSLLDLMKPQLELALPRHLTADRLCRVAITQIQRSPKLLKCAPMSLCAAVMTAAQLGLEPDGTLGQAFIVPFGDQATLIVGYKGLIALARNSGEVSSIQAQPVYDGDEFSFEYGTNEHLIHKPCEPDKRGKVRLYYAYARFNSGAFHFEVMTLAEVHAIRDKSKGYQNALKYAKPGQTPDTPWATDETEMGRKTAIRRLSKYLPLSVQKAVAINAAYEDARPVALGEVGELLVPDEDVTEAEVLEGQPAPSRMDEIAEAAATTTQA